MDINTLQYVVGEVKADAPATIRFFGSVTEENTSRFNDEFDFLENVIRPSCIRVLINSEGGSVLYGMSTYSTIANSKVDTECVIEGVAASMASIIWAAGKRSLMRDYAILMIHNPMMPSSEDMDVDTKEMVKAFFYGVASALLSFCISIPFEKMGVFVSNYTTVREAVQTAFFAAAIPEEVAKYIMLWLFLRKCKYFDQRMDGIVYAVCVSLGFAALENVFYLIGNYDNWMSVGISRALTAVPGHFGFGVLMGYYYSLVKFNDDKKTLAFSDNVQDAAHRAGFFNSRTWRFGLRTAIQKYCKEKGDVVRFKHRGGVKRHTCPEN